GLALDGQSPEPAQRPASRPKAAGRAGGFSTLLGWAFGPRNFMKNWPSADSEFGGADPLVRSRRPRRPAWALPDADLVLPAAGRGVPRGPGGPPHPSNEVVFRPCWDGP